MRAIILLTLSLGACATAEAQRPTQPLQARDYLTIVQPKVDCLYKAAYRYDDGKRSVKDMADQMLGVCVVESMKARRAAHLPINDPELDLADFKLALDIIDAVRKSNARR